MLITACAVALISVGVSKMYKEIAEQLRSEASKWCTNCCYKGDAYTCVSPRECDIRTRLEAADALEKLSDIVNAQRRTLMAYGGETGIKQMKEYAEKYWALLREREPSDWIRDGDRIVCPKCGGQFHWSRDYKFCPYCGNNNGSKKNTCADCYWYSDMTVHVCEYEKEPTSEDQEACPLFEPREDP